MDTLAVLKKHRRVYLATPYTKYRAGIHQAWKDACELAAVLFKNGIDTYSPIVHHHPIAIAGDLDPLDHKIWLPANQSQLDDAEAIVVAMMQGWDESYGVKVEIADFERKGKPIYFLHPVTFEVTEVKVPVSHEPVVHLFHTVEVEGYNGA